MTRGSDHYFVYRHTFPNGKVYIGITGKKRPEDRWHGGRGYKNNRRLFNAIQKYGWDNIVHEVVAAGLSREEAEREEIRLIAEFKSASPEHGYNLAAGGKSNSGFRHREETKKRISASLCGSEFSKERREHLSEAQKKLWEDPQHRKRMRDLHVGKMSGKNHPMSKAVIQMTLDGETIGEYSSMGEAERMTGISHQKISDCCRGVRESCEGFRFKNKVGSIA